MYTPVEFVTELVFGVYRLAMIFLENVILSGDPLTAVSAVVGQVFILVSVIVIAYLAVGALAKEIGIDFPALGR